MTTEITLFHLSAGARVHVRGQTYANTVCRKQKGNEQRADRAICLRAPDGRIETREIFQVQGSR